MQAGDGEGGLGQRGEDMLQGPNVNLIRFGWGRSGGAELLFVFGMVQFSSVAFEGSYYRPL